MNVHCCEPLRRKSGVCCCGCLPTVHWAQASFCSRWSLLEICSQSKHRDLVILMIPSPKQDIHSTTPTSKAQGTSQKRRKKGWRSQISRISAARLLYMKWKRHAMPSQQYVWLNRVWKMAPSDDMPTHIGEISWDVTRDEELYRKSLTTEKRRIRLP